MFPNRRHLLQCFGGVALSALAKPQSGGTTLLNGIVVDEATGRPLPCTVAIRKSDGELVIESQAFLDGFRCNGAFRKVLPPGLTRITITRGFDFRGEERKILLREGEESTLDFRLARQSSIRAEGWACGDNHVHMTHGESKIIVDFPYVALTAQAQGLDYLSIAQRWNLPNPTAAAVSEACKNVSTPESLIAWNMEAPKNYFRGDVGHCLGHGWFVGARTQTEDGKDAAVELSAMSALDYQSEKQPTPNFETHALIHELGGSVAYTHPCRWWWGNWGGKGPYPAEVNKFVSNLAQELPFDTVVGPTYDSVDILMQTREKEVNAEGQQLWFKLLNRGYRIVATASTDASFDSEGHAVPGRVRTYTHLGSTSLSTEAVARSMRAGKNFVTSGPLLLFTVDGQLPGAILRSEKSVRRTARVRAWSSGIPGEYLTRVEFVLNGEVVRSVEVPRRATYFETEHVWTGSDGGWIIARCLGADPDHQVAIANPVYLESNQQLLPEPTLADVKLTVRDRRTASPLSGQCQVLEMIGRTPRPLRTELFQEGTLALSVPGTARLKIEVPGYAPQVKSIFLDCDPILNSTLNMRAEQLLDWSTFELMKRMLGQVNFVLEMDRV